MGECCEYIHTNGTKANQNIKYQFIMHVECIIMLIRACGNDITGAAMH